VQPKNERWPWQGASEGSQWMNIELSDIFLDADIFLKE